VATTNSNLAVRAIRRVLDILVAGSVLVLLSPLLAVTAIAIKLDSRGPVFFKQVRLGKDRKPFLLYKFRGMYVDARERWPELYDYAAMDEATAAELRFHQEQDPRVTRVGRFLRRTSIDELPNLINVLRGEMHLVGPRPEIPELAAYYTGEAARILDVRPGVTSLAKATGRDSLTFAETVDLELRYLRSRSLRMDVSILRQTAVSVLARRDVVPGG
jgi:lipopolysaccharide/colanic/teichoic acid biosynthesis glycosyltransferase